MATIFERPEIVRSVFVTGLRDAHALEHQALALGHTIAPDEILKNSFVNFAFENFEAASYKALITIAEVGNFGDAVPLLRQP